MSESALSIVIEDKELCIELAMTRTILYSKIFTPSEQELHQCPHIILSLPHPWEPHNLVLPRVIRTLEEKMSTLIHIEDMVFIIDRMNRKISSLKRLELGKPNNDPGKSDMPITHKFKSSDRQSDVTAQDLSECWGISISTDSNTLKKTTQKFLRITVLPLSRIYIRD